MIARPFIEVMKKLSPDANFINPFNIGSFKKIYQWKEFFSQPFDIRMLGNPVKKPAKKIFETGMQSTSIYKRLHTRWQKAEDKVLFKGWELDECESPSTHRFISKQERGIVERINQKATDFEPFRLSYYGADWNYPKNLDVFIIHCTERKIKLSWKGWVIKIHRFI